jgi:hypothetical protein
MGENFMRVFAEVERVAKEMQRPTAAVSQTSKISILGRSSL